MPAVPFIRARPGSAGRPGGILWQLTLRHECMIWLALALCAAGLRWYLADHLPTYIWTRDSGSYLAPAVDWLNGGQWVTSARRGPVYSLFLAAVLRGGGTLATVANIQAVIGFLTAGLTVAFIRSWLGRRSALIAAVCTTFYVFYSLPLELEKLIRNETILVFLATLAFGSWHCGLRKGSSAWLALGGLFTGLMHLLKGIFPVYPIIVLAIIAWNWRRQPRRFVQLGGVFLLLFLAPLAASKLYSRLTHTGRPPEPEDGQMFLGRTAQWTYFGTGGVQPDLKVRIRDQAEAYAERYRRTGKLDNNEIVKRTVVPTLKTIIVNERGGNLVEVNRACWRLGLEAVAHHPGAYLRQFLHDLFYLNFISAQRMTPFEPKALLAGARDARIYATSKTGESALTPKIFDPERSAGAIIEATRPDGMLQRLARLLGAMGRIRFLSPVFLTTISLALLTWVKRGRERWFWIGNLLLWTYYLVLLSTVGRPLDRYLMPVVPIMFWAITTLAAHAWRRWLAVSASRKANVSV